MGWLYPVDDEIKKVLRDLINNMPKEEMKDADILFWFKRMDRGIVRDFYNNINKILGNKLKEKLIIVLDSPGGEIHGAYLFIEIIRQYYKNLEIIVPCWAKSAATLICLAADKLYLTPISELGPLDPQVREPGEVYPKSVLDEYKAIIQVRAEAFEILDHAVMLLMARSGGMSVPELLDPASKLVSGLIQPLYNQIDPAILGKRARQLDIGEQYAKRILERHCSYLSDAEEIDKLVKKLVYDYPSHSFVIDYGEAVELGLPVELLCANGEFDNIVKLLCDNNEICLIGSFNGEEQIEKTETKRDFKRKGYKNEVQNT